MENSVVEPKEEPVIKKFDTKPTKKRNLTPVIISLVVIILGALSGFLISRGKGGSTVDIPENVKVTSNEAGIEDESQFTDSVEGILEKGGTNGEGTHHLVRDGGPSKYVYLTSSVADLDPFVGKKVKVWGETIAAQEAGWLMDVGKIKVVE